MNHNQQPDCGILKRCHENLLSTEQLLSAHPDSSNKENSKEILQREKCGNKNTWKDQSGLLLCCFVGAERKVRLITT